MSDETKPGLLKTIQQYGKRLFGFVRGRVESEEDAEDIVQEVWYQLSRMTNLEEIENMSGWLFQVARNRITDNYRRKRPERTELFSEEGDEDGLFLRELLLPDGTDADFQFFREVFWEELMKALEEMPQDQRNVFVWNELEDMTLQEIADKTGENVKTIISRKRYAVQRLRTRLQFLYDELNDIE